MRKSSLFILFLSFILCSSLQAKTPLKKHNVSICAIFKNEAPYLKEWIEFHRLIGVDHFYLYNLSSTDRYRDVLKDYVNQGIVSLIHWPDLSKNQKEDTIYALGVQIPAYENAIKYMTPHMTKWLVFVDIDEFLLPIEGTTLPEIVEKYKDAPGISLTRVFFDASKIDPLSRHKLIVENTKMTEPPPVNNLKTVEKMIFKPELCTYFTYPPYRFVFKGNKQPIQLNKWEMRVNRYINRNSGYLNSSKSLGTAQVDFRSQENEVNALLHSGFEVEEHAIERFVPILKRKMGF